MHAPALLGLAALIRATTAMPAAANEEAAAPQITEAPVLLEKRADITAPWVEVDDLKQPVKTHSPSITTKEDGSTEVVDAAPHDLTASVFTNTYYGLVTTSTGSAPLPSATNKDGDGAFARCFNTDGDYAPLCDPVPSSTMYKGTTYYGELTCAASNMASHGKAQVCF